MTKKDYILIAGILSSVYGSQSQGEDMRAEIIEKFKKELIKDNKRFDAHRFGWACNGWAEDLEGTNCTCGCKNKITKK